MQLKQNHTNFTKSLLEKRKCNSMSEDDFNEVRSKKPVTKDDVIKLLIKRGNNPKEVKNMVDKQFDAGISAYPEAPAAKIADFIRSVREDKEDTDQYDIDYILEATDEELDEIIEGMTDDELIEFTEMLEEYADDEETETLDEAAFYRLPNKVIGNELFAFGKAVESFISTQRAGSDFNVKSFDDIIKMATNIKRQAKKFTDPDSVPKDYIREDVEQIGESVSFKKHYDNHDVYHNGKPVGRIVKTASMGSKGYSVRIGGITAKYEVGTEASLKAAKESAHWHLTSNTSPVRKEDVEQIDEAVKIGSKVVIHAPGKKYHGKTGYVGEIRHGLYKGAPKSYTVDFEIDGSKSSIRLDKKNIKMYKEEVEQLEEAEVRHDRYMRSHGKKASGGHGQWMFTHKDRGGVDYKNEKEVHTASGKFTDAAKSAKAWAKKHGYTSVYVMEQMEGQDMVTNSFKNKITEAKAAKASAQYGPDDETSEVLEPRSEAEQDWVDNHEIDVTDRPDSDKPKVAEKVKKAPARPGDNTKQDPLVKAAASIMSSKK